MCPRVSLGSVSGLEENMRKAERCIICRIRSMTLRDYFIHVIIRYYTELYLKFYALDIIIKIYNIIV